MKIDERSILENYINPILKKYLEKLYKSDLEKVSWKTI
jgi:hypothetical protein